MDIYNCLNPLCEKFLPKSGTGPCLCLAVRENKYNNTAVIETKSFKCPRDFDNLELWRRFYDAD